ncbi:hypothetical protein GCM10010270_08650 [Streptomyces violaceus]|nr:hypothetical protein GCM10010270_08650 [Streptomyces janthinus]
MRGSGGEQDPFGDGGLAGVDVGEDAEVADDGERVVVDAHGPWPFEAIRKGAARFPGEAGVVTHACFGVLTLGQQAEAGAFQTFVPVIRRRPRSGHRSDEDTRITSYRDRETTTAVWSRIVLSLHSSQLCTPLKSWAAPGTP